MKVIKQKLKNGKTRIILVKDKIENMKSIEVIKSNVTC